MLTPVILAGLDGAHLLLREHPVEWPGAGSGVVLVGLPCQLVVAEVLGPVADVAHAALVVEHVWGIGNTITGIVPICRSLLSY